MHKNLHNIKEHLNYFSSKNSKNLQQVNSPEPGGCSSTPTHRWVLQTNQSPIYYRLMFIHFIHVFFQFDTFFLSDVRWQDILFCNFWLQCWIVRIANVYGFWVGIITLYFQSIVSVPLYSVKLSGIYSQKSVGFLLVKLFSPMFHFFVYKVQFRL